MATDGPPTHSWKIVPTDMPWEITACEDFSYVVSMQLPLVDTDLPWDAPVEAWVELLDADGWTSQGVLVQGCTPTEAGAAGCGGSGP